MSKRGTFKNYYAAILDLLKEKGYQGVASKDVIEDYWSEGKTPEEVAKAILAAYNTAEPDEDFDEDIDEYDGLFQEEEDL